MRNTIATIAIAGATVTGTCTHAANPTAVFGVRHLTGEDLPGVVFDITRVSIGYQSNQIAPMFTYTNVTGADGTFSTTILPGSYRVQATYTSGGRTYRTVYTNCFDDTAGTLYTGDPANLCGATSASNTVAFSQSAANARFVLRANGFATNLSLIQSNMALPSPGQVWTSIGTNGWGAWSNSASGAGEVTTAQLNTASNLLRTNYTALINTESNRAWAADDHFTNRTAANLTALSTFTNTINTVSNRATSLESQTNALGARVTSLEGMTNSFQSGTNFAGLIVTNTVKRPWVWQGFNTNQTIDWSKTNHVILQPSNTVTIAFANTPSAGSVGQELRLEIYNTNSSSATVVFPSSIDWLGVSPVYLSGTNFYRFLFAGTNLYGFSGQQLTTGTGETNVLSVSPALVTPSINGQTIASGTSILTNPHAFQPPSTTLSNLSGTRALTNIASLAGSNATVKTILHGVSNDVIKTFGIEQGTNTVLYMTPTSIVINASAAGGGGSQTPWTSDIDAARFKLTNEVFKPVNVRWFGAVGDNSTDDSAAFEAAFAAAGSTNSVYVPAGRYAVKPLVFNGRTILGDGHLVSQIRLRFITNNSVLLWMTNGNQSINGVSLLGSNTTTWQGGTATATLTGLVWSAYGGGGVSDNLIAGFQTGLHVQGTNDAAGRFARGIVFGNNICTNYQGITFGDDDNSAEYILCEGNQIRNCFRGAVNYNGGNIFFQNNVVTDCDNWGYLKAATANTEKGNCSIRFNVFNHTAGVRFEKWSSDVFENNHMQASANVQFENCTNVTVRFNTFSGNVFIPFSNARGINFSYNRVTGGTFQFYSGFTDMRQCFIEGNLTNGVPDRQFSVVQTNAEATLHFNAALSKRWITTNRISAATSCLFTNTFAGQDPMTAVLLGEISGGTSRVITIIPELGHLVANQNVFGTALATSASFTLTNGNAVEIRGTVDQLNGTNVLRVSWKQFAF